MMSVLRFSMIAKALWLPGTALGHDGTGVSIGFIEPAGVKSIEGNSVTITWDDEDTQEDAVHQLYIQGQNIPPTHVPASKHLEGTLIHEVAVTDTTNSFTWDITELPSGTYAIYALTTDPALCRHVEFAQASIVIQKPDDPMPVGVFVTAPFDANIVGFENATLEVIATAPTQPTLSLTAGTMIEPGEEFTEDDPLCDPFRRIWSEERAIANALPMESHPDRGEGWWIATVDWSMSDVPNDFYAIRAQLQAEGVTTTGWSHAFVAAVYGEPTNPSDDLAEGPDSSDSDASNADGNTAPVPVPSPTPDSPNTGAGGCHGSPVGQHPVGVMVALFCLVLATSRFRQQSGRS